MFHFSKENNANHQNISAVTPNICPHCHVANEPQNLSKVFDNKMDRLLSIWRCNFFDCKKLFAVSHHQNSNGEYLVERYLNGLPKGPIWPEPIQKLKDGRTVGSELETESKFIKTYLQSLVAESEGLDEIAGMGYRKAIEYLVKDWAIQSNPGSKEKVLNQWLSASITEFFSGGLKDILERATWLGNDQAHYNKLFEEYNLEHLKELIGLIMAELDREFRMKHYIESIEKRK